VRKIDFYLIHSRDNHIRKAKQVRETPKQYFRIVSYGLGIYLPIIEALIERFDAVAMGSFRFFGWKM
jgi:hypothetical protein